MSLFYSRILTEKNCYSCYSTSEYHNINKVKLGILILTKLLMIGYKSGIHLKGQYDLEHFF